MRVTSTPSQESLFSQALGVCLSDEADNHFLLQRAREEAKRRQCALFVIYIDVAQHMPFAQATRGHIDYLMEIAARAGATPVVLSSDDVVDGILTAADLYHITHMMVGHRRRRSPWANMLPSIGTRLLRQDPPFELQVITLPGKGSGVSAMRSILLPSRWQAWFYAPLLVILITAIVDIVQESLPEYRFNAALYNVSMMYLLAIVFCSLRWGLGPAILSALFSFFLYNFFFVPPFYTFGLKNISGVLNLALFLLSAGIAVAISGFIVRSSREQRERMGEHEILRQLTQEALNADSRQHLLVSVSALVSRYLNAQVAMMLVHTDTTAESFPADVIASEESERAQECVRLLEAIPARTPEGFFWVPMATRRRSYGAIGIRGGDTTIARQRLYDTLARHVALALERLDLLADLEQTRLQEERERLRSALLSSVSHDLKTPLVSILGALTSIRHMAAKLTPDQQAELLGNAIEETERLNRFISNILDMIRLEHQSITIKPEWIALPTLATEALERHKEIIASHRVVCDDSLRGHEICADPVLMTQVMYNLLDNASKYSPRASTVRIWCDMSSDEAVLCVSDEGAGVPEEEKEAIFDKCHRLSRTDSQVAGTGLGLAICRAIVTAHGGKISVYNNPHSAGATFTIHLPIRKEVRE